MSHPQCNAYLEPGAVPLSVDLASCILLNKSVCMTTLWRD